jgi:fructose-1,6-bisphosphatase
LYLDNEGINKLVLDYEKDTKALKRELYKICWYMRGSISIEQAYNLTIEDRELVGKIIEDNLETTKKSGLPFF